MSSNSITHFISSAKDISDIFYIETYFRKNPLTPLSLDKNVINDLQRLFDTVLNTPAPSNDHMKGLLGIIKCLQQLSFCKNVIQWQTVHEYFVNLVSKCTAYFTTHLEINDNLYNQILQLILEIIIDSSKHHLTVKNKMLQCLSPLIFDVVINNKLCLSLQKQCIKALTCMVTRTDLEVRRGVMDIVYPKLAKFFDQLYTCGDFDTQLCIVETILRFIVPDKNRKCFFLNFKHKNPDIIKNFLNVRSRNFDVDCRIFLNYINKSQGKNASVISIPCSTVLLDEIIVEKPTEQDIFWIDFNRGASSISLWCNKNSLLTPEEMNVLEFASATNWQLIVIKPDIIKKAKIKSMKHHNEQTNFKEVQFFLDGKLEIRPLQEIKCSLCKCIRIIFPRSADTEALKKGDGIAELLSSVLKIRNLDGSDIKKNSHVSISSSYHIFDLRETKNPAQSNETMKQNDSVAVSFDGESNKKCVREANNLIVLPNSSKSNGTQNSWMSVIPPLNLNIEKKKKKHIVENALKKNNNASNKKEKVSNTKTKIEFQCCVHSENEKEMSASSTCFHHESGVSAYQSMVNAADDANETLHGIEIENVIKNSIGHISKEDDTFKKNEESKENADVTAVQEKFANEFDKMTLRSKTNKYLNSTRIPLQSNRESRIKISTTINKCMFSPLMNSEGNKQNGKMMTVISRKESLKESNESTINKVRCDENDPQKVITNNSEEKNDVHISHERSENCFRERNFPSKNTPSSKEQGMKELSDLRAHTYKTNVDHLVPQNRINSSDKLIEEDDQIAIHNENIENNTNKSKNRPHKASISAEKCTFNTESINDLNVAKTLLNNEASHADKCSNNCSASGKHSLEKSPINLCMKSNMNVEVTDNHNLNFPSAKNDKAEALSCTLQNILDIPAARNYERRDISVNKEKTHKAGTEDQASKFSQDNILIVGTNDKSSKYISGEEHKSLAQYPEKINSFLTAETKEKEIATVPLQQELPLQSLNNSTTQLEITTFNENEKNIMQKNQVQKDCNVDPEGTKGVSNRYNFRSARLQNIRQEGMKITKKALPNAITNFKNSLPPENVTVEKKDENDYEDTNNKYNNKKSSTLNVKGKKKQRKSLQISAVLDKISSDDVSKKSNLTTKKHDRTKKDNEICEKSLFNREMLNEDVLATSSNKVHKTPKGNINVTDKSSRRMECNISDKTDLKEKSDGNMEKTYDNTSKTKEHAKLMESGVNKHGYERVNYSEIEIHSDESKKGESNNASSVILVKETTHKNEGNVKQISEDGNDHKIMINEVDSEGTVVIEKTENKENINNKPVNAKCELSSRVHQSNVKLNSEVGEISYKTTRIISPPEKDNQSVLQNDTAGRKNRSLASNYKKQNMEAKQIRNNKMTYQTSETIVNTEDETGESCSKNMKQECNVKNIENKTQTTINKLEISGTDAIPVSETESDEVVHTVTEATVHAPLECSSYVTNRNVMKRGVNTVITRSVKTYRYFSRNITRSQNIKKSLNIENENKNVSENVVNACIEDNVEKMYVHKTVTNELKSTSICQNENINIGKITVDNETSKVRDKKLSSRISDKTTEKRKTSSTASKQTRTTLKKCPKASCPSDCLMYRDSKEMSNSKQNLSTKPTRKRKVVSYVYDSVSDESDISTNNKRSKYCEKTNTKSSPVKSRRSSSKRKLFTQNHVDIISLCSGSQNSATEDPPLADKTAANALKNNVSEMVRNSIDDEFDKLLATSPPPLPQRNPNRWAEKYKKEKELYSSKIISNKSTKTSQKKRTHSVYSDFDSESNVSICDDTNDVKTQLTNTVKEVRGKQINANTHGKSTRHNEQDCAKKNEENNTSYSQKKLTDNGNSPQSLALVNKDIVQFENINSELKMQTILRNTGNSNLQDSTEGRTNPENMKKRNPKNCENVSIIHYDNNNSTEKIRQSSSTISNERSFEINMTDNDLIPTETTDVKKNRKTMQLLHEDDSDFVKTKLTAQRKLKRKNKTVSVEQNRKVNNKIENTGSYISKALTMCDVTENADCTTTDKYSCHKSLKEIDNTSENKCKISHNDKRRQSDIMESVIRKGRHEMETTSQTKDSVCISGNDHIDASHNIKITTFATKSVLCENRNVDIAEIQNKSFKESSPTTKRTEHSSDIEDNDLSQYFNKKSFSPLKVKNSDDIQKENLKKLFEHVKNKKLSACSPSYELQIKESENGTQYFNVTSPEQRDSQNENERHSEHLSPSLDNEHFETSNLPQIQEYNSSYNKSYYLGQSKALEKDFENESGSSNVPNDYIFNLENTFPTSPQNNQERVISKKKILTKKEKMISKSTYKKHVKEIERTVQLSSSDNTFSDFDGLSSSEEMQVSSDNEDLSVMKTHTQIPRSCSNAENDFKKLISEKVKYVNEISTNISESVLNSFSDSSSSHHNKRIAERKLLDDTVKSNIQYIQTEIQQLDEYREFLETVYEEVKSRTDKNERIENEMKQRIHDIEEAYGKFITCVKPEQELLDIQQLTTSLEKKFKKEIMRDMLKKLNSVHNVNF